MLSFDAWRPRRGRGAARPRSRPAVVESLERRDLLAYSALGFSLPDLTVSGYATPVVTPGGQISVTAVVSNIGASSMIEPLSLQPQTVVNLGSQGQPLLYPVSQAASSTADVPALQVAVYLSRTRRPSPATSFEIGTIYLPSGLTQNSQIQLNQNFTMPANVPGLFAGEKLYLMLFASNGPETDVTNNGYINLRDPITVTAPQAAVQVTGLDVPPVMQPGDTIQPNIRLVNNGSVDTSVGGPLNVYLVASTDRNYGPGSSVIAHYTVQNIVAQSSVSTTSAGTSAQNVLTPQNVETLLGEPVTLPKRPNRYFIGVVVNPPPQFTVTGRSRLARTLPLVPLQQVRSVGPPIPNLPPAGVIGQPLLPFPNPFPFPNAPTPLPSNSSSTTG